MSETQWYLTRQAGKKGAVAREDSFGPLTTDSLLKLASSGKVGSDALVWIDGTDVLFTLAQFQEMVGPGKRDGPGSAVPSPAAPAADNGLPDWLAEMAQEETRPVRKPQEDLDWLEDVRQSEGLAAYIKPSEPGPIPPRAAPPVPLRSGPDELAAMPLDWLQDIRQIEESLRVAPPSQQPTPARPAPPPAPASVPVVEGLKMALPVPAQVVPPAPPTVPVRIVCPPPTTPVPSVPGRPVVPSPVPIATGYDAETGQILDAEAYALYQKAEAQRRQQQAAQPTLSVAEVFIHAHRALQNWADADENKSLILRGDVDSIKACPAIREVLDHHANYGPIMRERLERRLTLLVDNRKKFLKAFGLAP